MVFNYWFSVISQSLGLSGLCSRLNRGDGLLAAQVALDGQELQTDHEHRNHAPSHVHGGLPDRGGDLRLAIRVLPAVGGRVQDVVRGLTHGLHGSGGLIGDVVGDLGGGKHRIVARTHFLIGVLVAVAAEVVGQDEAFEAPLAAQHGLQQRAVGAGIGVADVVEGAHHGLGAAFLHAHLERLQIDLTHGLLVRPRAQHFRTLGLLVIQSEVLHEGVHALGLY